MIIGLILLSLLNSSFAEQIIVEAARIDGERVDPSRSVTVLTAREIESSGATTVAEVLRSVPGVQLTRQGAIGQTTSVFIRGARSEGTLVLIDGAEVNDPSSPSCGYDFSSLSVGNIERIEVYRGPQSVRFGSGALGGVVNIVSKEGGRPAEGRPAEGRPAEGRPAEGRPGGTTGLSLEAGSYRTLKGAVTSSRASERFGVSTSVDGYTSEGISAARGGSERDGVRLYSFAGKVNWKVSDHSEWIVNLRGVNADVEIDGGGGPLNDDPNLQSKSSQLNAGIMTQNRFLEERLKTRLAVTTVTTDRDVRGTEFRGRNFKTQADGDYLIGENHTVRVIGDLRHEAAKSTSKNSQSVAGVSLTHLYESETWFYDWGARADESSVVGSVRSTRVSLGRRLWNSELSATYGSGFKLPSLFQLYSTFGDLNLQEERAHSVDLSWEQTLSKNAVATLTYYQTRSSNLIDFNMATNRYYNVAKAQSEGVELSLTNSIGSEFRADLNYAYIDARDESTGLGLLRRPFHSAGVTLNYFGEVIDASVVYRYRGSRPDLDPATFERLSNEAYDVFEVGGAYKYSSGLKFTARVENVFDRTYEEVAGYGTPGLSAYLGMAAEL